MASAITGQLDSVIEDVANSFRNLTSQIQQLSTSLQRMATVGLSATAEGNRLSFVWMKFTQQIASVMLPAINFLQEKLIQLTNWFRGLSGDGQSLVMKIGLVALAFTAIMPILGALAAIFSPLALTIAAVAGALYLFFTETDTGKVVLAAMIDAVKWMISKWEDLIDVFDLVKFAMGVAIDSVLAVITKLAAGVAGVVSQIMQFIPGLGDTGDAMEAWSERALKTANELAAAANAQFVPRQRKAGGGAGGGPNNQVNPVGFGFESFTASFERITSGANKMDIPKAQLKVQEEQLGVLGAINAGVKAIKGEAMPAKGDH